MSTLVDLFFFFWSQSDLKWITQTKREEQNEREKRFLSPSLFLSSFRLFIGIHVLKIMSAFSCIVVRAFDPQKTEREREKTKRR